MVALGGFPIARFLVLIDVFIMKKEVVVANWEILKKMSTTSSAAPWNCLT